MGIYGLIQREKRRRQRKRELEAKPAADVLGGKRSEPRERERPARETDSYIVLDTATGEPVPLYRKNPTYLQHDHLEQVESVTEAQAKKIVRRARTRLLKRYIVAWHPTRAELEARKEKSA